MSNTEQNTSSGKKRPKMVGKYTLEKLLGKGGMGEVWLSRHPGLDIPVAVKILKADNENSRQRFIQEGKLAASINHQNIVRVFDADCEGDDFYLVMEYIEGEDYKAYALRQGGLLDIPTVLDMGIGICEALSTAHKNKILHRDIKPENILISKTGEIKLADLGIAKLEDSENGNTLENTALGTPYYISPEQAKDASTVDRRTDIYSLGATLYHLLTGTYPFSAKTPVQMLLKHINEPLEKPEIRNAYIPLELSRIICKMMEKDSEDRYPSCKDVRDDLLEFKIFFKNHQTDSLKVDTQSEMNETMAATDPEMDETMAATDPEMDETMAATDPEMDETMAATDPEMDETMGATDPEMDETMAATDPEMDETMGATDPEMAETMIPSMMAETMDSIAPEMAETMTPSMMAETMDLPTQKESSQLYKRTIIALAIIVIGVLSSWAFSEKETYIDPSNKTTLSKKPIKIDKVNLKQEEEQRKEEQRKEELAKKQKGERIKEQLLKKQEENRIKEQLVLAKIKEKKSIQKTGSLLLQARKAIDIDDTNAAKGYLAEVFKLNPANHEGLTLQKELDVIINLRLVIPVKSKAEALTAEFKERKALETFELKLLLREGNNYFSSKAYPEALQKYIEYNSQAKKLLKERRTEKLAKELREQEQNQQKARKIKTLKEKLSLYIATKNWPNVKSVSQEIITLSPLSQTAQEALKQATAILNPPKPALNIKESIAKNISQFHFTKAVKSLTYINDSWATDIETLGEFYNSSQQMISSKKINSLQNLNFENKLKKLARLVKLWEDTESSWFKPSHKILLDLRDQLFIKLLVEKNNSDALQSVNLIQNFSRLFDGDIQSASLKLIKTSFRSISQEKIKTLPFAHQQSSWPSAQGLPETLTILIDQVPFEFILIPESKLTINNDGTQTNVKLSSYYILKWELTNRQYQTFTKATGYSKPQQKNTFSDDDQPVTSCAHLDASHFCRWLSKKIFKGKATKFELPSEMQYQLASQGISSRPYSWGHILTENSAFYAKNSQAAPYKSLNSAGGDISYYGVRNLAGNVSEWCKDNWSGSFTKNITPGAENYVFQSDSDLVLSKGANFTSKKEELPVNFRQKFSQNSNWDMLGFRVVINNLEEFTQ